MTSFIPFNQPYMTGKELLYISEAHAQGILAGDGPFTKKCHAWLEARTTTQKALLTHSCTAALEMSALLLDIKPGDEIIMPSYTFVSTASAFVLRGGVPVFVDIRPDTLNLDEQLIERALSPRTKAIVPVHYAGVSCEMDTIMALAQQYGLAVVEDAAQGISSLYKNKPLGSLGTFGTYSFHETKNIISGEGGALLVNDPCYKKRAEIIREKGTNRTQFFRGEVDKYTWHDLGSSFLPGEITAAFLWAQLEAEEFITKERLRLWHIYHEALANLEEKGLLRRPIVPPECQHNAHLYYLILNEKFDRAQVLAFLKEKDIGAIFHYVPLHSSPAGTKFSHTPKASLPITETYARRLIRLPLWIGLTSSEQERVVNALSECLHMRT